MSISSETAHCVGRVISAHLGIAELLVKLYNINQDIWSFYKPFHFILYFQGSLGRRFHSITMNAVIITRKRYVGTCRSGTGFFLGICSESSSEGDSAVYDWSITELSICTTHIIYLFQKGEADNKIKRRITCRGEAR